MHIVLLKCPHVRAEFLKFTSCDNQALVRCIPIATVAAHLKLKSKKLVSHLIRCIAITYWIFNSLYNFKCPCEKCLETYRMHLVYLKTYIKVFVDNDKWFYIELLNSLGVILSVTVIVILDAAVCISLSSLGKAFLHLFPSYLWVNKSTEWVLYF